MIRNYQDIQDSNLKGEIAVQYHEETEDRKLGQDKVPEENKNRQKD